ncbi:hypothetical protein H0H92_008728 [Tricholoma furcatifolium]|nr:hypothetical protein H0H92_008728 [Tricholoma furcatifolium]
MANVQLLDALWIRILVFYLFVAETANTCCDMYMMYEPLIIEYVFSSEPFIIVAVSTPIQMFFAWRIWKLTKSIWIPLLITLFALVSFGGGCWTGVKITIVKLFAKKPELHYPALMWFLSACLADVLITASLVYSLSKRRTGFVVTDDAISKIIRMTVQTGMLTAVFAVGDVVFFMTLPHTALNFLWDLALSKLYSNCLLSTLNARASLNEKTSVGSSVPRISTGPSMRRQIDTFDSPNDNRTFELDTTKSFDPATSYGRDVEFGITVTKVVERMEDPRPVHPYSTTQ